MIMWKMYVHKCFAKNKFKQKRIGETDEKVTQIALCSIQHLI